MGWEIWVLACMGAGGWYWLNGLRAREHAIAAGRHACTAHGMQFLDETVALTKTRLARNSFGQLQFQRFYQFEFSSTGDNRHTGNVHVLGQTVQGVEMDGDCLAGKAKVISID